jgi:hypothetical protein
MEVRKTSMNPMTPPATACAVSEKAREHCAWLTMSAPHQ